MVLIRRCAAGLLLAAGALSLVSPGGATPPRPGRTVRLVGSPVVSPGQARLEAMKVEMAWLANLATYGLPLEVHITDSGLRACGRVPDDAARVQVLEVARQASCLPVVDSLTVVQPGPVARTDARALEEAARAALRRHLAEQAAEVQVRADDTGVVSLRGEVATVEDKLVASRCLKGIAGCTAVNNSLGVTPLRHAGHTVTLVTRDGQHHVHGTITIDASKPAVATAHAEDISPAPPTAAASAPVPYVLPPSPSPALPSGLPANKVRVQVVRGGQPTEDARPIRYISGSGQTISSRGYPGYDAGPANTQVQAVQTTRPSLWERLTAYKRSRSAPEVVTPAPAPPAAKPAPVVKPVAAEPPVMAPSAPPPSAVPPAQPAVPRGAPAAWPKAHATAPADEPSRPAPVSRPLSHLVRVSSKPAAPAQESPQGTFAESRPLPPIQSQPAVQAPPVQAPPPPAVQPVGRVERPAAPAAAPAMPTPEGVMQMVQSHCGELARDVRVESYKDGSMIVKVYAAAANEGRLVSRLLTLPALPGDKVKLQVVLGR